MGYKIVRANCFHWLDRQPSDHFHAVLTDPPYGTDEFKASHLRRLRDGSGGIWRIPPTIGGSQRKPLPRFTVLSADDRERLTEYFALLGRHLLRVLRPGGHALVASNVLLAARAQLGLERAGFEFRGTILRELITFRGGDRPKLAEKEFPDVAVSLRGGHEPWILVRKPLLPGMTVAETLRQFGTGGLRRVSREKPFIDVVDCGRTPQRERHIAPHPTLKPQALLRQFVRLLLPMGEGEILDPFMGSGSTVAAAKALGIRCVGVERDPEFYALARRSIAPLAKLKLAPKVPRRAL